MGKVNVIIVDATGNKEQKVGLPDDIKIGIIMVKLVEKIKLPSTGPDGNPISYKFIHKVSGRQLLETQTLADAQIKDGDVLRLQPEITAGAVCPNCNASLPDGTVFCTQCGQPVPATQQAEQIKPEQPVYQQFNNNSAGNTFNEVEKLVSKSSKFFPIIGMLSGIVSFILGIVTMSMPNGGHVSLASYGGDAYTGIQNAAAITASNVQCLTNAAKFGLGAFLVAFGLAVFCYFGSRIKK